MLEKKENSSWITGGIIFLKISGWIVGPIIIALFLGKYLDKKYNTAPWLFLGITAIAFIISLSGIIKESYKYIKEIEENNIKNKKIK